MIHKVAGMNDELPSVLLCCRLKPQRSPLTGLVLHFDYETVSNF